jgi:transcriptional regulator with XRE-family HTH domain
MEIDKRIITLIEILGLTPGEFADKINVQRSSISHITSARNKPSLDFLERTLSVFSEINAEWLILGKGKPLKTEEKETSTFTEQKISPKIPSTPLLFPVDDLEETPEIKSEEIPAVNTDNNKNDLKDLKKEEVNDTHKKEIKKIVILYDDNSFEVYNN